MHASPGAGGLVPASSAARHPSFGGFRRVGRVGRVGRVAAGAGDSGYERWVRVDAVTGEQPPPNLHQDPLRVENGALLLSRQEYQVQAGFGRTPANVLHVRQGRLQLKQAVVDHIVRHDPVHSVADIDAKRRMVTAHTPADGASEGDPV